MWNAVPPAVTPVLSAQFRFDLEMIVLIMSLVVVIGTGVAVMVWVKRRWLVQQPTTLGQRLEDYRALAEQGLLAPEEFERIRVYLEKSPPPALPDSTVSPCPSVSPVEKDIEKEKEKE